MNTPKIEKGIALVPTIKKGQENSTVNFLRTMIPGDSFMESEEGMKPYARVASKMGKGKFTVRRLADGNYRCYRLGVVPSESPVNDSVEKIVFEARTNIQKIRDLKPGEKILMKCNGMSVRNTAWKEGIKLRMRKVDNGFEVERVFKK